MVRNPGRELVQIGRCARHLFGQDHDGIESTESLGSGPILSDTGRELGYSTADWYFRGVLELAVAGLPLLYRRSPRPQRRIVFAIFGAVLVIPLLLWGNPRFHQPLVPLMALSAGALTVALAERVLGRRTGRGVGPSAGVDESDQTGASGADRAGPPGEASLAEEAEATGADKLEATGEARAAAEGTGPVVPARHGLRPRGTGPVVPARHGLRPRGTGPVVPARRTTPGATGPTGPPVMPTGWPPGRRKGRRSATRVVGR